MRKLNDSGDAVMIGAVIAGLIAIIIGVLVWYKINSAVFASFKMPYGAGPYLAQNTTYATINTTANTVWTLFPIVAIVVIAGVILAIVMGFGRQQA